MKDGKKYFNLCSNPIILETLLATPVNGLGSETRSHIYQGLP